jgi:hypothetical protein
MVIATTDSARLDYHVKTDALSGAVTCQSSFGKASNPTAGGRVIADIHILPFATDLTP